MSACRCGCCAGVTERTPLEVQNRPGLSAIAYRVATYPDFRASLVAGLTDANRPELAKLGTRDSDDFTIALLDSWAVASDVLTFYSERLAQEAYLRTARERISLQELARLIGYRLRPGVAAQTPLAFALEPPPDVPASTSRDPGSVPPVTPPTVTIEPGLRVQSIPGPGEQPQTFEAVEEIEARPEWNAIPASTSVTFVPGMGDTHAYLKGSALNLKPGDVLLFAGQDIDVVPDHWDVRILQSVDADAVNDRTLVTWDRGLGSSRWHVTPANPPIPFALRKRIDVFGHNAPLKGLLDNPRTSDDWTFAISKAGTNYVDLDGSHPDVTVGSWVVLSIPTYRELFKVQSVTELSRADYATSGNVTRLLLEEGENYATFASAVRETTVFAVQDPLEFAEAPDDTDVENDTIRFDVDVSDMRPGRRLLVHGTTTGGDDAVEEAAVKSVSGDQVALAGNLMHVFQRSTVVVYGNVALATHGETVQQLLGSGRAASSFQRFTLAHDPLTYVQSSSDPSGAQAALEVRVNDVRWDETQTLFEAGSTDRDYVVRSDEQGKTYVQFGDGENGSRLPSGTNNVRAKYRKGLGAGGNVKAGALAQLIDRPLGVKGVSNPENASGGVDPESEEAARASIPLGVRTLGRAVSLLDYEDFARAFSGVAKAQASVLQLRGGRTIVVTVAFSGGDRLDDLATAIQTHGDPHVQVLVLSGVTQTFRIALKVAVDPAYDPGTVLTAVEAALRSAYSFDARDFGEPVFHSEIDAVAHSVAGVLAVDVDRLYVTGTPVGLAERLLAQRAAVGTNYAAIPGGVLVIDDAPFDALEQMSP
jgi:Baseplate J-like protein